MKEIFNKNNLIIFGMTLILLLIVLLSFYPGIKTYDGNNQWNQAQEFFITNAHPFSSTFFMFLLSKICNNIVIITIVQILIFSVLWTSICRTINKNKKNKIKIIYTIIMLCIPIISLYSITIWKDIIYSYCLLFLSLIILVGVKKDFNYSYLEMIWISVLLITTMNFRHNGIVVAFIMIIIFMILLKKNKIHFKKILIFLIALCIVFSSFYIPKKILVKSDENSDSLGIKYSYPIFLLASYVNEGNITSKENEEFLSKIMPIEKWKEYYDPYLINKIVMNDDIDNIFVKENYKEIINILVSSVLDNPNTLVKHLWKVDSIAINPLTKGYIYIFPFENWGTPEYTFANKEQAILKTGNVILTKLTNFTMKVETIYRLIYTPAIALYLSIALMFVIIKKTKNKKYFLILLPVILNTISILPINVAQDLRYVYINHLTLWLMVIPLILFTEGKGKMSQNNTKTIKREKYKSLVIIPAYNEEKSIKKVVESIYKNTSECDVVVINDGSKDDTYNEAKKTKANVINLPNNLGIGGAVQTGYLYAYKNDYDIAIQVDADGQHDPKYINEMIEFIKNGQADMVIGSRFVEKTSYKQTFFRMLGINITSGVIKVLTGKRIYDTTSGFRAINRDIIESFVDNYPYDYPEPCTNMEMIIKGKEILEIPVEMKQRETGVSSISPLKSVKYMLKVILSLFLMRIKRY